VTELNKNDCITIKISKAEFAERFSHWECDVFYKDDEIGGGTSPTSGGVFTLAYGIAHDYLGRDWFETT
jgi:hypothetical protein